MFNCKVNISNGASGVIINMTNAKWVIASGNPGLHSRYAAEPGVSRTATECEVTWHHQSVDVLLSAFPAGRSSIAQHAARYPGDPLWQLRQAQPDQWHMTLGYHQTEKFKTRTQKKDYTGVGFLKPTQQIDHLNNRSRRELKCFNLRYILLQHPEEFQNAANCFLTFGISQEITAIWDPQ